jgi:hypothetical protein
LKQQKYNGIFVRQMSEAVSMAFNAWMDARNKMILPFLNQLCQNLFEKARS